MAPFRRIAIVGLGLIGGSVGLAIRRRIHGARVVGIDRPGILRRARRRRAVHEGTPSLARGLQGADLVILALPVESILEVLPRVARLLAPAAIVTDVGGTKNAIVVAARRAGLGGSFVGGHPMAGSELSGIENASGTLFAGAPWILCAPLASAARSPAGRVSALVRRLGARPAFLASQEHDGVMARLSHLPQLISVALVNAAVSSSGRHLHLSGPAFRQMSRLATSPPSVWSGILKTNRPDVTRAIDDFIRELRRLRASLERGPAIHFRRAARARRRMRTPAGDRPS
jgi:prephenate dehydrogenase